MMFNLNITSHSRDTTVEIMATGPDSIGIWCLCFCVFNLLLLLGTLTFIAVSWYKIKLWRQFKNYIFLNIIITVTMLDVSKIVYYAVLPTPNIHVVDLMYKLSMASFSNWLLVMCIVIYTKIVKVFSSSLQNRYLKVNAFAWGISVLESVISTYVLCPTVIYILHVMSYVILGFYLSIIYALVKLALVRMVSNDNSCQIVRIFVYVTSAFSMLVILQVIEYFPELSDILFIVILFIQVIFVAAFLSMKSHRELWDEHLKRNNRDVLYIMT